MNTPTLVERLSKLYTGAVHDVLRGLGHANCVLPSHLRPLDPSLKVAGPAWTVSGHIDHSISRHDSLLGWTTLLSKAPSGHVVVCQPHNQEIALMGELSAETLKNKGVLGYVVDGGCRDTDFILELGFPVVHTFLTIGSVTIHSGDHVLGDRDGVVVIPQALVAEVVEKTEAVALTENQVREAIRGGMDPVEAYLKYGKF
jgi:regulator of RNase E activity RraA